MTLPATRHGAQETRAELASPTLLQISLKNEAVLELVQGAMLHDVLGQMYEDFGHERGWVFSQGICDIVQP